MRIPAGFLTIAQAAVLENVSAETIRRRIQAGELPAQRLSGAKQSPWVIDAVEWDRQRAADAERAKIAERLQGAVVGRGEGFIAGMRDAYGPEAADYAAATAARHDLFERLEAEMAADPGLRQRLERLDEDERFEAEARELARRARRLERLHARAQELLDEDEE